jgi:hypothetical protein
MSVQTALPQGIDFFADLPIVCESSNAQLSGDGGLLAFRQLDERLGLTRDFATAIDDPRDPDLIEHSVLDMVRQRVYGILADYEDQNDADSLRADPIFKLILGRRPDGPDLPSQPTLSRFENSVSIASLKRLRALLVDRFIRSFTQPPSHLTFDLDAVDDPAHGQQQLTFWHNYYDQNQYYPLVITCAENDLVVGVALRHGSAHATLGADDDLEYLISRVRAVWPDVVIYVRGDAAFGVPLMCDLCERLDVFYSFGLTANDVLQRRTEDLLSQAVTNWQQERQQARQEERAAQPSRLFEGFWYRAGTWEWPRFVVAKAEANEQGTNRRFVVTNRPGAPLLPGATYDEYAARGESENRNKELKVDLHMGRLSDHRFCANFFRLFLHVLAMNLVVFMRRLVALPEPARQAEELPSEALAGEERQQHFRERRQRDVLGEAQPATWRRLLIKVAVQVVQSSRRIVIRLSQQWPHLELFRRVLQRLAETALPLQTSS